MGKKKARRATRYWLFKSEPTSYSIDDLANESDQDNALGRGAELSGAEHAAG